MLDLMEASVAVIVATTSATAAAAAAAATTTTAASTCAAGAAAIRPSPLLPSSAAHNHQKCCQREQVVVEVAPEHHVSLGVKQKKKKAAGGVSSRSCSFLRSVGCSPFKAGSDHGAGHRQPWNMRHPSSHRTSSIESDCSEHSRMLRFQKQPPPQPFKSWSWQEKLHTSPAE